MEEKLKILVFGQLTDITKNSIILSDKVADTEMLLATLYTQYPALAHQQFLIAVNKKIAREKSVIADDAEIALLPPYSGG